MIDLKFIGYRSPTCTLEVEKGRLRQFAKAIGETRPVCMDDQAARQAGYPGLLMPPTFLFCLEMDRPEPYGWFDEVGIPLPQVLHAEQGFTYHAPAFAGDALTFNAVISDIHSRKGGLLEFVVQDNTITNQHGQAIADFRRTLVIRHG